MNVVVFVQQSLIIILLNLTLSGELSSNFFNHVCASGVNGFVLQVVSFLLLLQTVNLILPCLSCINTI